jgi:sec-independent protein translocase protein TatB
MFNIGGGELLGLLVLGMILIGPDRMPSVAADAARFLVKLKNMAQSATNELKENLGPGYEDLQVKDLHPKTFIKKHIGDVIDKSDFEMKSKPKIDPDIL